MTWTNRKIEKAFAWAYIVILAVILAFWATVIYVAYHFITKWW